MAICKNCLQICRMVTKDFGEGITEYCGYTKEDINVMKASSCCEADCYEDEIEAYLNKFVL